MINIDDRLIKEVSPKIRPNALSVLLAIAIHLNQKTNRCFPSHERLMALTGLGRDAVYVALDTLKKHGLLKSGQPIDSKTKKFGRRVFKVSTKFISIFVAAQDAEPLPENPYTEKPYTEKPYTEKQETYQINKEEQINELEQINNDNDEAADENFSFNAERKNAPPHIAPPPPPPGGFRPLDIAAEIERLEADDLVKENFQRRVKLPVAMLGVYVKDFSLHIQTLKKTYSNVTEFRSHFFNYCDTHKKKAAEGTTPQRANPHDTMRRL